MERWVWLLRGGGVVEATGAGVAKVKRDGRPSVDGTGVLQRTVTRKGRREEGREEGGSEGGGAKEHWELMNEHPPSLNRATHSPNTSILPGNH